MKKKLPEYFGILPKADLVVKRVEAFREQPGAAQHYIAAHAGRIAAGHLLRPPFRHERRCRPTSSRTSPTTKACRAITCRSRSQQELTGIPKFRTQYGYGAYSRGLGPLFGSAGQGDGLRQRSLSTISAGSRGEIWRAIRLVVDTGIHAKGWTSSRRSTTSRPTRRSRRRRSSSEVERYIAQPGQATQLQDRHDHDPEAARRG